MKQTLHTSLKYFFKGFLAEKQKELTSNMQEM